MKLEELLSTLQSQPNGNMSNILGSGTTHKPASHSPVNLNSSQSSSTIPPARLDFQAPPNLSTTTMHHDVPPIQSELSDQLSSQNPAGANSNSLNISNSSAHTLLDGLMKSPLSQNGPFTPPTSASAVFPGYFQQQPFAFSPPRPSIAPFPQPQAFYSQPHHQVPPFGIPDPTLYRHLTPFQSTPPVLPLPSPQQQLAYQHYFAYYYNYLSKPGQTEHPFNPPPGFVNELVSESASSRGGESSLSSSEDQNFKKGSNQTETSSVSGTVSKKASIRVDVNDLFSLSKAYSEANANTDPNKILFDLIQKQQMSGDRNPILSNSGETVPYSKTLIANDYKKGNRRTRRKDIDGQSSVDDDSQKDIISNAAEPNGCSVMTPVPAPSLPTFSPKQFQQQKPFINDNSSAANLKVFPRTSTPNKPLGPDTKTLPNSFTTETKVPTAVSNQKAPKELTNLNENFCLELLKGLRRELLATSHSISAIVQTYDWKKSNYMYTIIKHYFDHLKQRLQAENVSHLNLIDSIQYSYDDFASYGPRFREYIKESNLFSREAIVDYTSILTKYERLFPNEILELRRKLLSIKLKLHNRQRQLAKQSEQKQRISAQLSQSAASPTTANKNNRMNTNEQVDAVPTNCPVSYKMVTYQKIDAKRLHSSVSAIKAVRDQIGLFKSQICLSQEGEHNRNQFLACLNEALQSSEFAQFGPRLHKFGSLSNGLGTYDSDLDIVIKLENVKADILDYSTSMLALEVIELILQDKLGIRAKDTIVPSKRCPIIKLNFSVCFPFLRETLRKETKNVSDIEFNKCDISLITVYGVYNSKLLNFLTLLDNRFRDMTLILKYWAKKNELIDNTAFSTYGFTMMIIFFLQNTNPPVLPPIARLQELAKCQPGNEEVKVHKFNFQFCNDIDLVGKSKNTQNIQDLLLEFFRFYATFDFYNNAISPRLGIAVKKINMRADKLAKQYDNFNMASYVCIEDPFVLEHNVGYIFRARNIHRWNSLLRSVLYKLNPNNCLRVLVDPGNFNICKNLGNLIYLPFNLFCHEVNVNAHFLAFPIQPSAISLNAIGHQVSIEKSIVSMKKFFFMVIRQLLVSYFAVPNTMAAFQLELTPDGIVCSIDFSYLSHINFKLDFRSNRKYDALFQNVRKRASDGIKRFTLLKMLREDLKRSGNPKDLRNRSANPSGILERWFKLELARHPSVHQAQMPQASYETLVAADDVPIPFFLFRLMILQNSGKFATANKFGELLQDVLQQFSFSIDRANPVAAFNAQVEEFFDSL